MVINYVVSVVAKRGGGLDINYSKEITEQSTVVLPKRGIEYTGHEQSENEVRIFLTTEEKHAKAYINRLAKKLQESPHYVPTSLTLAIEGVDEVLSSYDESVKSVKPFDIWAVPISGGQFGFVQILDKHPEHLYLTKVYDLVSPQVEALETILMSSEMFPCVFSYIDKSVIKKEQLIWVGNRIVEFEYPLFRQSIMSRIQPNQTHSDWYLWSNENGYRFVGKLSNEQWDLQFLSGEPIGLIAKRIKHRIGPRDEDKLLVNGWAHL